MSVEKTSIWSRQRFAQHATGLAQRIVVVTDVEGTMPGDGLRSRRDVQEAVDFLAARGIPLVINSSRTRAEIERLHQTLQLRAPLISEYGAALLLPHGSFPFVPEGARTSVGCDVLEFASKYDHVVETMRLTCREVAVDAIGFADLSIEEAGRELGVALVEAQLAKLREYTELFRIVGETPAKRSRLFKALRRRGLRCWPAGRHYLATGGTNRADSLRTLRRLWKQAWGDPIMIGFGDSDDDGAWLQHVDIAVILRNQQERADMPQHMLAKLPAAHVTKTPGPRGWSEAIFEHVGAALSSDDHYQAESATKPLHAPSEDRPP